MSEKDDDKTDKKPDGPGGVQHDARGNAVWQWAVESGRHAIEATSQLLRRLEVPGLKLEDDPEVLKDRADALQPGDLAGPARITGYDPYGGSSPGKAPKVPARTPLAAKSLPAIKQPPGATALRTTKPAAAAKPTPAVKPDPAAKPAPSLLQRLFRRD